MTHLLNILQHYGLPAIFVAMLIESIGLPLPAYPLLIIAAGLSVSLNLSLAVLFLLAVTAGFLPDLAWYAAGRRYGTRILGLLCRISISPEICVRSSSDLFARWGAVCLLFIKFVPAIGNLGIVLAGATRLRLTVFALFDLLGSILYVAVGMGLGLIFRNVIEKLLDSLAAFGKWGAVLVAVLFALYLIKKVVERHWLLHRLRMDRITADDLAALLEREDRPIILDVRPADQRERDGMIPGALFAEITKLDVIIQTMDVGRDIVVYCSCPNEISAAKLAQKLRHAGFKKIRPLLGGIDAWTQGGYPVERIAVASLT